MADNHYIYNREQHERLTPQQMANNLVEALHADMTEYNIYYDRAETANKIPLTFEQWEKAGRP